MTLRFSRSSLNLIIFTCIILIGWASIDKDSDAKIPTARTIDLPALSELKQQSWTSREGIQVVWQPRLDTDFKIRIRGQRQAALANSDLDSTLISWQQDHWQWDINIGEDFELGLAKLSKMISDFPVPLQGQSAVIILQGPWSADIARLTSARLIKSLQLKPLQSMSLVDTSTSKQLNTCPWQPVSAQYWLQDQLSNTNQSRADINNKHWLISDWPSLPPINEDSLYAWKQTFVQQWQLNWPDPATQFDILADLAYYRLPQNYLLQGYWGINALDIKQLENYLAQCSILKQASEQTIQQISQH